jgi:hypothetical protein
MYGVAGSAMAFLPGWLWHLSGRRIRMANTSEELLDLFEERYGKQHESYVQAKRTIPPSAASLL